MSKSLISYLFLLSIFSVTNQFDLSVLHFNDFHARFDETSDDGGTCKNDQCIGGLARFFTVAYDAIEKNSDLVLLNAGDNFQGTLYYNLFRWNITQYFLNFLPWDATTLGNHEFDHGIAGVVPFIQTLATPVIVSNIDDSAEPDIQNIYNKSVVIERNGKKIGIIGVILQTTNELANTEGLKFLDESESVNAEAERLVREEDVFTNIVLSHSGYDVEQEIARKATAASKITLIVGSHSHTFLYTGEPVPGPLTPAGPYPTIVKRGDDGKEVLVVQASAYCRYVGNITVNYNDEGDLTDWEGAPIFLSAETPKDSTINELLEPWREKIDELGNRIIGRTLVQLDRSNCRYSECLLGNFVTDAMVYAYTSMAEDDSWTYAALAMYNVGGLRTTIEQGDITYNDMISAQPFENTLDVGEIEGRHIKEIFENSMTPYYYRRDYINVNLLQVSGFKILANLSQPVGSRLESIKVRCQKCRVPVYEDLDLNETYRLIVPSFLRGGGDGFAEFKENLKNVQVGQLDIDVYENYLQTKSPIFQEIDGRITFVGLSRVEYRNLE